MLLTGTHHRLGTRRIQHRDCTAERASRRPLTLPFLLQVDWMEERMPYYPPTVNDPEAYKFAIDVASRCVQRRTLTMYRGRH